MNPECPTWLGASQAYSKAYKMLHNMAMKGHVSKPQYTRSGLYRCSISEQMDGFIKALHKGEEEEVKHWLHLGYTYGWDKDATKL